MKKNVMIFIFLFSFITKDVLANAADDLKKRLNKMTTFHASFTQKIFDKNGIVIQNGCGELWIKRPNFFNWHMLKPDENILISNGKTLWFYNPSVEQVTITCLKDTINDTPLMLIISNQKNEWEKYDVKKNGKNFILTPKNRDSDIKKIIIDVSFEGNIRQFTLIEYDNSCSNYKLQFRKSKNLDNNKFSFNLPENVIIDDQRV